MRRNLRGKEQRRVMEMEKVEKEIELDEEIRRLAWHWHL